MTRLGKNSPSVRSAVADLQNFRLPDGIAQFHAPDYFSRGEAGSRDWGKTRLGKNFLTVRLVGRTADL